MVTQVPDKVSSIAGAIRTSIPEHLDIALHVGTENVTIYVEGKAHLLWPLSKPDLDLKGIPLPADIHDGIANIIDEFKDAASVSLGAVLDCLIALGFFCTAALVCLAALLFLPSGHCSMTTYPIAFLCIALVSDGLACLCYWLVYRFLLGVLDAGKKFLSVNAGHAVGKALLGLCLSAAQSGLTIILSVLFLLYKFHDRQAQRNRRKGDTSRWSHSIFGYN